MAVTLSDAWGNVAVSHRVAAVMYVAQTIAVRECSTQVSTAHLTAALLDTNGDGSSQVGAVLKSMGVNPQDLRAALPLPNPTEGCVGTAKDADPDADVCALLVQAGSLLQITRSSHITTVHCLAALAGVADPWVRRWHSLGLTTSTILMMAARCGATSDPDDVAFAPLTAADPDALAMPPAPTMDDLTRTPTGRRSPFISAAVSTVIPSSGKRISTPLGLRLARRWARWETAYRVLAFSVGIGLIVEAVGRGPLWVGLLAILPLTSPTGFPSWIWIPAHVGVIGVAVWVAPWLAAAAVANVVAASVAARYELWMKRIDLCSPAWRLRDMRRAQRERIQAVLLERLGLDDDEPS